jgi:ABC-type Mn2+/Zn2+ transport system permease subunit
VLEPFTLPYVQRGILEVLALAVASGVLGTWIVLRGLAFYSHAVAAAAFPGLVLADGLGFAAGLGAFGTAALFALAVGRLAARDDAANADSVTALALVGALAAGIVLASDVFTSGSRVDTLLFGSLLAIGPGDVVFALVVAAVVVAASVLLGGRWLAVGFDAEAARTAGVRSRLPELALLVLIALVSVAALSAVGALLAAALLVVPAVTTRLVTNRMAPWQAATIGLAAAEGVGGLWLSVQTNAPPGATIATLSGAVFALVALARVRMPAPAAHKRD